MISDMHASRISCALYAAGLAFVISLTAMTNARARSDISPQPRRIVSINMCTDHLALQLADRDHILSVTFSSADPGQSLIADQVKGIELNGGHAEQIISLNPDLILSGTITTSFTNRLLIGLGYNVVAIPFPENLEGVRRNIRLAARAIGVPERGEHLIQDLDKRLSQALAIKPRQEYSVLILAAGGLTHGRQTLAGDLLALAGFQNSATSMGIDTVANVSLETVLRTKPDVIVLSKAGRETHSLSSAWLEHPALKHYLNTHLAVDVPWSYIGCETPYLGEALKRITSRLDSAAQHNAP